MPERSGNGSRVGRSVSTTLVLQWGRYAINLAGLVLLARLLQPVDYGLVTEAVVIVGLASVVGDLGLSLAAIQAPSLTQAQRSALFWVNGALGLATGAVIASAAPLVAIFYEQPKLIPITLALASIFVFSGFSVQFKVDVNRALRFWALGLIDVLSGVAGLAVAVVAAVVGLGYWALVSQQVVAAVVALIVSATYSRWRPSWPSRRSEIGQLLRFGRDTFALHLANYVTANLDSVLVGRFFGASLLGLYNRAFQVVVLPLDQVLAPLTRVLLPRLAQLESDLSLNSALVRLQRVLAYTTVGALSLLASTSTSLFTIVLGSQWSAAAVYVQILVVGAVFQALGYVYYWGFLARSRTGLLLVSEMWGRVPMIVLMLLLGHLGAEWVAAAVAVGQFLIFLAGSTYYAARVGVRVRPLLEVAVRPAIVYAIAAGVSLGVGATVPPGPSVSEFVLRTGVWAASVGIAFLVVPSCRQDLRAVVADLPTRGVRARTV